MSSALVRGGKGKEGNRMEAERRALKAGRSEKRMREPAIVKNRTTFLVSANESTSLLPPSLSQIKQIKTGIKHQFKKQTEDTHLLL
jgi:hypothetical protein